MEWEMKSIGGGRWSRKKGGQWLLRGSRISVKTEHWAKNCKFSTNVSGTCTERISLTGFHSSGEQLALIDSQPATSSSHKPSYSSCQSPQITLLIQCVVTPQTFPPSPALLKHFDMVSTSTCVTDWTIRHMTSVQTGDKNKIRHVSQCEEVSGNESPTLVPLIHTLTDANCKHMICALVCGGARFYPARCVHLLPAQSLSSPNQNSNMKKGRARRCNVVAQIESDSLTHNIAPIMWLGQRGTLSLNSHIPKSGLTSNSAKHTQPLVSKRGAERTVVSPALVPLTMLYALRRIEMMLLLNHNPLERNCKHM